MQNNRPLAVRIVVSTVTQMRPPAIFYIIPIPTTAITTDSEYSYANILLLL